MKLEINGKVADLSDYFDDELGEAILVSLFSDQRVTEQEAEGQGKRGWWGDLFEADPIGSKLWLLYRERILETTLERARQYCVDALQWLIDDGVVKDVDVKVTRLGLESMAIEITVTTKTKEKIQYNLTDFWSN